MSIFVKEPPNDPKTLYETREQGSIKLASLGMSSKPQASKREVRHLLDINPKPFCAPDINCNSFAIFVRHIFFTLPLLGQLTRHETGNVCIDKSRSTAQLT